MNSTKLKVSIIIVFLILLNHKHLFSQKYMTIGSVYTYEMTSNSNLCHGVGVSFEKKYFNCIGLESGLLVRVKGLNMNQLIQNVNYEVSLKRLYLSVPILLKYYNKIVDLSVGPNVDYYVGYTQRDNTNSNILVTSYSETPKFTFGLLFEGSKAISIYKNFIIEPKLRYNPKFKYIEHYLGCALSVKYKL